MLACQIPALRAFAFSLARNRADADDLVQETLVKAWAHRARFETGQSAGLAVHHPAKQLVHRRRPPSTRSGR
ncbi:MULTISPECIES: sigma factor [Brevundimonas]|uniref:sigma factor n=1 Tax=Brevundimonas sp. 357 TaxID=2555782 RepID=UPI001FB438AE|nr:MULTISPECIES: sigma factor [Brevundimonas]